MTLTWIREENYFVSLPFGGQNYSKLSQDVYDKDLLLRQETQIKVVCPGSWYSNN